MWILDSTGGFLDGKRVWLRPGKKYLFGRPPHNGVHGAISKEVQNASTISRQHMTIEVSSVTPRDGARPRTRTKVTITDLNSSRGTTVDGQQIKGNKQVLGGDEHIIKLGRYAHSLRMRWEPVVLSFSFSSKEMRSEDPLAKYRSKLEDLDIKTIIPYLVEHTTHVVQSKRNTAKGLQALINGKSIVNNAYIDALVYATTPTDFESDEALSPLEADFDAAWPNPNDYLPPAGNEPISRPAASFAPNPSRINVFEGYTFVFGDPTQFENLQAAINNGQGKALLYDIEDGVTTANDIVRFMRESGGQLDTTDAQDEPEKVVLVRFRSKGELEPWSIEVSNEVALMTDRRVIEQREFLDAILGNDASPLCRPLPREEGSSQESIVAAAPEPPSKSRSADVDEAPAPSQSPAQEQRAPTSSKPKASRVRKFVSKMKTFDDGFDMASIPVYNDDEEESNSVPLIEDEAQPSQMIEPMETVEKDEDIADDLVQSLLPGAKAMKRRREEIDQGRHGTRTAQTEPEPRPKAKRAKLDVLEAARKYREEEEEQRRVDENSRPSPDVNVEELKNLAIIEEMEIPVREPFTGEEESSDRWDDRWNGRKNFKRFRRKGEPRHARQRIQSVIVPLEEVTRKDFGIGEHYWVTSRKSPARIEESIAEQEDESSNSRNESAAAPSQPPVDLTSSPEPTPDPRPVPSRSRNQKRPREVRGSDSDEELRFRFRRKR
ncbi:hypothetical protein N7478_000050 [Penicillium angulare]|uniref:uncharacterized protein n=1 Tax=Penicillium angulare TaxID=116970 RepID=UPI00254075DD|nr:uncharacterized protein N7478_000050 [Penicillium angulare]KAJ5290799.1 hypothetical protein N7478_000050 [Penicillium angulare]